MDRYYQPSSIRIFDSKHRPVGTGIYVGDHLILTCEHVVAKAQGRSQAQADGYVPFDFAYDDRPLGAQKPIARVLRCWPDSVARRFGELYDVALLRIKASETIPDSAVAAPLSIVPDTPNETGQVFGFANESGLSVTIRCGLQLRDSLVELFFDQSQVPVTGGHSGSPVWNASKQVIGMVIERDDSTRDDTPPKAYMLPAAQFKLALAGSHPSDSSARANTQVNHKEPISDEPISALSPVQLHSPLLKREGSSHGVPVQREASQPGRNVGAPHPQPSILKGVVPSCKEDDSKQKPVSSKEPIQNMLPQPEMLKWYGMGVVVAAISCVAFGLLALAQIG